MNKTAEYLISLLPFPVRGNEYSVNGYSGGYKDGYNECLSDIHAILSKVKVDISPRLLHELYLEAIKSGVAREQYNPNAVKSYDDLSDEQKSIDKHIAQKLTQANILTVEEK